MFIVIFGFHIGKANIILVPQDFITIQSAIDAATEGDTVIVDEGRYYENLKFKGKDVVLTSKYIYNKDTSFIRTTIIDGSQPVDADSATCVYFGPGNTEEAVLQGFTITGGTGTKMWTVTMSFTFREGGAISIEESSPIVRYNLIKDNYVTNTSGIDAIAGGGAIRCRYSDATIENNVIMNNEGFHNGGIAIYWSAVTVRNNIIYNNVLSKEFGGAALLIENNTAPTVIENNTIIGNKTIEAAPTGGIYLKNGDIIAKNNIIWGNTQLTNKEVSGNGTFTMSYNNITLPRGDNGEVNSYPVFSDTMFYLAEISAVIDSGDTAIAYNDIEAAGQEAAFPSKGGLRNDMGAYGGPHATILPRFDYADINVPANLNMRKNYIGETIEKAIVIRNLGTFSEEITDVVVKDLPATFSTDFSDNITLKPIQSDTIAITWIPEEVEILDGTIEVYHNSSELDNPLIIAVEGEAASPVSLNNYVDELLDFQTFPNPFTNSATLTFSIQVESYVEVEIYNSLGQQIELLMDEYLNAGDYQLSFDAESYPEGTYYCRIQTEDLIRNFQLIKQ